MSNDAQLRTLFVIHAARGMSYVIEDMLAMIAWTCGSRPYGVIVIADLGKLHPKLPQSTIIIDQELPETALSGFHCANVLQKIATSTPYDGIRYDQVIMLSDECMIINSGLDVFFSQYTSHESFGVTGVGSGHNALPTWNRELTTLIQCKLPVARYDHPDISLCDDILVMSHHTVHMLAQKGQMLPRDCENWSGTFGDYIAWACYFNDKRVIKWGYDTRVLPPLYVTRRCGHIPPPHLLNEMVSVVAPSTRILGYSEVDIRELYKKRRNEPARELPKLQPLVCSISEPKVQA